MVTHWFKVYKVIFGLRHATRSDCSIFNDANIQRLDELPRRPPTFSGMTDGFRFADLSLILGASNTAMVSGRKESLPVVVDVLGLPSPDLHLIDVIQQCRSSKEVHVTRLKASLPTSSF